jgi:hypothetical protein
VAAEDEAPRVHHHHYRHGISVRSMVFRMMGL